MNRQATLRIALIKAMLLLLLCLTVFTGTTFAWLTDSVYNQGVIRAGSLHVDMEHLEGGEWISLKKDPHHKIFHYSDWEPGYADLSVLKIKNDGNLALRFKLLIALDETTSVLGPNGESIADVIDVYFHYGKCESTTRTELEDVTKWKKMGTVADLLEQKYVFGGKILPADMGHEPSGEGDGATTVGEAYISIVLSMRSTAGNEYQHLALGEFVLALHAVQSTFEEDNFDDQYDRIPTPAYVYDDGEEHLLDDAVILTPGGVFTEAITVSGANTNLNITGGYYDAADQRHTAKAENGGVINITGGTFLVDGKTENDQTVVVAGAGGQVNIYGGKYYAREDGAPLLGEDGGKLTVYAGTFTDWNPADDNGKNYLATGTAMQTETRNGETVYVVTPVDNVILEDEDGNLSLGNDTIVMNSPLMQDTTRLEPYVFDGQGHTITINAFPDNDFKAWDSSLTKPGMSTYFSTDNGSLVTVKNVTLTGTMQPTFIGHYRPKGDPYAKYPFKSVLENFNVSNAVVAGGSNPFSMAVIGYGDIVFNNCTITGTTPVASWATLPCYDVALTNNCYGHFNAGTRIGALYLWESSSADINDGAYVEYACVRIIKSSSYKPVFNVNDGGHVGRLHVQDGFKGKFPMYITIKSGGTVDVLDLTDAVNVSQLVIEEGAIIGKVVDGDLEYESFAAWKAAQS